MEKSGFLPKEKSQDVLKKLRSKIENKVTKL